MPGLCLTVADAGKGLMNIHGPDKISSFMHSTRYFMRVPDNRMRPDADCGLQMTTHLCDNLTIHAVRLSASTDSSSSSHVCYVGQTAVQKGKFDIQRAAELRVPKGPLFGLLKGGSPVTLDDGSVVSPDDVLGPSEPSRYFMVVCSLVGAEEQLLGALSGHAFIRR